MKRFNIFKLAKIIQFKVRYIVKSMGETIFFSIFTLHKDNGWELILSQNIVMYRSDNSKCTFIDVLILEKYDNC